MALKDDNKHPRAEEYVIQEYECWETPSPRGISIFQQWSTVWVGKDAELALETFAILNKKNEGQAYRLTTPIFDF